MSTVDATGAVHGTDGRFTGHVAAESSGSLHGVSAQQPAERSFEDAAIANDDWSYLKAGGSDHDTFTDSVTDVAHTINLEFPDPERPRLHVEPETFGESGPTFRVGSRRIDSHGHEWITAREVSIHDLTDDPTATGNDAARGIARRLQQHYEQSLNGVLE